MTRMLTSVTGPEEAEVALAGGADIIDLKDPSIGALGAVSPDVVRHTVDAVARWDAAHNHSGHKVSAVTGDLPMDPALIVQAARAMAEAGVHYVKIGFFEGDPQKVLDALAPLSGRVRLVAVLFADRKPDLAILPTLKGAGFYGAMLDTADKGAGGLLSHMKAPALLDFTRACRRIGLEPGLAGSLEEPDVPRLLLLAPAFLGFRRALTEGARAGAVTLERVRTVRALIPRVAEPNGAGVVDYRVLATRGYTPDPQGDMSLADRIFVRDLVLPVRIGTYEREREKPQKVRFTVEVLVAHPRYQTDDMQNVFSYDVITDGIAMLVEHGHVGLVETLAERIAAFVIVHPRVMKATVTVEKLEVGTGIVGVTIERTRETAYSAAADTLFAYGGAAG
ncbi:(5-formylfuran-3-yl)methyl phosphate synthase [Granulibacter bethesdensis]|uniref:(5-formylfuran-3-yl)methyl phosphate synthase n=1 Tax=Granulibacter bethesdensis TaxID=364410 RepID=UPI00090C26FD|nr:(5-formylfuran-3-yl)methyl phosphate synthase [Granulibacter bethesdensis]APH59088.1 Dihydroneopterin aldolase [Granulibacter bethesdensis]